MGLFVPDAPAVPGALVLPPLPVLPSPPPAEQAATENIEPKRRMVGKRFMANVLSALKKKSPVWDH